MDLTNLLLVVVIFLLVFQRSLASGHNSKEVLEKLKDSVEKIKKDLQEIRTHLGFERNSDQSTETDLGLPINLEFIKGLKKGEVINLNVGLFKFDHLDSERAPAGYKVSGFKKGDAGNWEPMEFYVGTRRATSPSHWGFIKRHT